MRKLFDYIRYYLDLLADELQLIMFKVLSALSFISIAFYFGYIIYYSVVIYSAIEVITGCLALFTMIHLNKSLGGGRR